MFVDLIFCFVRVLLYFWFCLEKGVGGVRGGGVGAGGWGGGGGGASGQASVSFWFWAPSRDNRSLIRGGQFENYCCCIRAIRDS